MAEVIEERFTNWQGQDFDEDTLELFEVAQAIMEYLDWECIPSMKDDDPITRYSYAKRESVKEGFVPVLIKADDETLGVPHYENDPDSDGEDDYARPGQGSRLPEEECLHLSNSGGLEGTDRCAKEEAEDDDMDWDEEILGEMEERRTKRPLLQLLG